MMFIRKISKRGYAPNVIENKLPPYIVRKGKDYYFKGKKLKMKTVDFKTFFGIESE